MKRRAYRRPSASIDPRRNGLNVTHSVGASFPKLQIVLPPYHFLSVKKFRAIIGKKLNNLQNFRFNIVTTDRGWDKKPSGGVATNHLTVKRQLTVEEFKRLIEKGYAFANIVKHKIDLFERAQTLSYDIDWSETTMEDYVKNLSIKPTLSYTSPSFYDAEKHHYKFRLVYILDQPVEDYQTYKALLSIVQDEAGICEGLDCGKNTPAQFMNGNGTKTMKWGPDGHILRLSDFNTEKVELYKKAEKPSQKRSNTPKTDFTLDERFRETLTNSRNTFFAEYSHLTAPTRSTGNLHHSGMFFTHEDGFFSILRKWEKNENGKLTVHRWKDGEQRRKKLFVAARVLITVNPYITNEGLVYNLELELKHFYDNSTDIITDDELISIAASARNSEWAPTEEKKQFTINKEYITEEPMTVQKRVALARRTLTDEKIGESYDASLTPYGNFKVMREMGMKVSKKSLYRFARENGLMEEFVTGPFPPSNNIIETKHPYILSEGGNPGNKIKKFLKRGFKNVNEAWKTAQSEGIDLGMGRNAFREYCKQHHPELLDKSKVRTKR